VDEEGFQKNLLKNGKCWKTRRQKSGLAAVGEWQKDHKQINYLIYKVMEAVLNNVPAETGTKPSNLSFRQVYSKGRTTAFIKLDTQKWVRINFNDVMYIEASEKMSILYFFNGEHMVCKNPLYKMQCLLPFGFERIHRAFIVNVQWVSFVDLGKKQVVLKNEDVVALGLAYKDSIARYFINPAKMQDEE